MEEVHPGEGALDDPAARAKPGAVSAAAAGDDRLDARAHSSGGTLSWSFPRSATGLAAHRAHAVDERQQLGDVVAVAASQRDRQRDPGGVDNQVVLGAGAGTVNRRGPGQSPLEEHGCGCHR
jgi:hypothetical protein